MKKIVNLMLAAALAFVVTGCEKESTGGVTKTTYYPVLELIGDEAVTIAVGDTYTDEGCVATLNGVDVSDQIEVRSNVNTSKSGFYTVTYSAANEDGFSASISREVAVVDYSSIASVYPNVSIAIPGATADWVVNFTYKTTISHVQDNIYLIDDVILYYDQYRYPGYPQDFQVECWFTLNDDNSLTLLKVGDDYWDFYLDIEDVGGFAEGSCYDPETGTVTIVFRPSPMVSADEHKIILKK